MRVELRFTDGPSCSGEVANLTLSSAFIRTSATPEFKDLVLLRAGVLELCGEVVFVSDQPRGFVLTFQLSQEQQSALAELIPRVPVLGGSPRRPNSQVPLPPLPIARPRLNSSPANHPALSSDILAGAWSVPGRFPELRLDGTLRFGAPADFSDQFRASIVHGGIIARSAPLSLGSVRTVRLVIPGIEAHVELRLRVGFVGEGSVGFLIERFPSERPRLESVLADVVRLA